MTETQAETMIHLLQGIEFALQAVALGVGFIWGWLTWHGIVQGKNEKGLW